ncbi:MAG: M28 family peptidase [Ignavibacteriales bacterium]|nr:M28 family peptidase [Ignavibacteriales bacterium]
MHYKKNKKLFLILPFFVLLINLPTHYKFQNLQLSDFNVNFSKERIHKHINYLGHDLFEGRGTGSMGGELSSKYIALQLSRIGIKPFGYNNSYYQHVPFHGVTVSNKSELNISFNNKTELLVYEKDYFVFQAGIQTYIPVPVDMYFVGYGITSPEYDYNDYEDIDVRGKVVVCLDGEPISNDENYFASYNNTVYSFPESKIRMATAHGAIGCIIIPNNYFDDNFNWGNITNQFYFENLSLGYVPSSVVGILIHPETVDVIFQNTDYNLESIYNLYINNQLKSFPIESEFSFKGSFYTRDFVAPNVVGIIEPQNKQTEKYIILSAHYDHLGIGPKINGDSIYNGVLDNALGVAGLLELAEQLKIIENELETSIIILFTTGEESGLLGSKYYVDHPVIPLYKTITNINIDGLAYIDNFKSIIGLGVKYSSLDTFFYSTAKNKKLRVIDIPEQFLQDESFYYSDQITFALAGIPSILIVDGPDYISYSREEGIGIIQDYFKNHYHTPFDDLSQAINYLATLQHLDFIYDLVVKISNSIHEPVWKSGSPFINARLRSIAEKR